MRGPAASVVFVPLYIVYFRELWSDSSRRPEPDGISRYPVEKVEAIHGTASRVSDPSGLVQFERAKWRLKPG